MAGAGIISGAAQFFTSRKDKRRAQREEAAARAEMAKQKEAFANVDTSNPFLGMENTFEDLTVNQQEAEFVKQQQEQQQPGPLCGGGQRHAWNAAHSPVGVRAGRGLGAAVPAVRSDADRRGEGVGVRHVSKTQ